MSEEEVFLNPFGMESHRTDEFIDLNYLPKKKKIKEATDLRAAFDRIVAAGLESDVETLMAAAEMHGYNRGRDDEAELHQTEDW